MNYVNCPSSWRRANSNDRGFMRISRCIAAVVASLSLSGCGTTAILNKNAQDPGDTESIVILKVNPANFSVLLFAGENISGKFIQGPWGSKIYGAPKEEYVVAKVKSGQTLGLTIVEETREGSFGVNSFKACRDAKALVFDVPNGQVAYLTDIRYERSENGITTKYTQDLGAAEMHMRSYYPDVKKEIVQLGFQMIPTSQSCGGGKVTIPIYIGS